MALAGRTAEAGRIPGQRIATEATTSDSAGFTAETEVMSVTASLVSGRRYAVVAEIAFTSTNSGDRVVGRVREDSSTGGIRQLRNIPIITTSTIGYPCRLYFEHTATATGDKTFVATGHRIAGSGDARLVASSTGPSYMHVSYIEG